MNATFTVKPDPTSTGRFMYEIRDRGRLIAAEGGFKTTAIAAQEGRKKRNALNRAARDLDWETDS